VVPVPPFTISSACVAVIVAVVVLIIPSSGFVHENLDAASNCCVLIFVCIAV
jgi:hypothetical protein